MLITACRSINCISSFSTIFIRLNHYKVLGIQENADSKLIKSAYYERCKVFHPDANKINSNIPDSLSHLGLNPEEYAENFRKIAEAYECLMDPIKRKEYDKTIFKSIGQKLTYSPYTRDVSKKHKDSFYSTDDPIYDKEYWRLRFEEQLKYQRDTFPYDVSDKRGQRKQPYPSQWWLTRIENINQMSKKHQENQRRSRSQNATSKENFDFSYRGDPSIFYRYRSYFDDLYSTEPSQPYRSRGEDFKRSWLYDQPDDSSSQNTENIGDFTQNPSANNYNNDNNNNNINSNNVYPPHYQFYRSPNSQYSSNPYAQQQPGTLAYKDLYPNQDNSRGYGSDTLNYNYVYQQWTIGLRFIYFLTFCLTFILTFVILIFGKEWKKRRDPAFYRIPTTSLDTTEPYKNNDMTKDNNDKQNHNNNNNNNNITNS